MKKIIEFLKLRKKSDAIKIASLMFLFSLYFLFTVIFQVVGYCQEIASPIEFILDTNGNNLLSNDKQMIGDLNDYVSSGTQREYNVSFKVNEQEKMLSVTEISESYLYTCFGITPLANKLYLNENAYAMITTETEENTFQITYSIDGVNKGNIELILCDSFDNVLPLAFSVGTSATLGESTNIRAMFKQSDVSGTTTKQLQSRGYSILNEDVITTQAHELEILFLKIGYGVIIIALSIFCGCILVRHA